MEKVNLLLMKEFCGCWTYLLKIPTSPQPSVSVFEDAGKFKRPLWDNSTPLEKLCLIKYNTWIGVIIFWERSGNKWATTGVPTQYYVQW